MTIGSKSLTSQIRIRPAPPTPIRTKSYDDGENWYSGSSKTITVFENDLDVIDTGLIDASGNRILRQTKRPIGFIAAPKI